MRLTQHPATLATWVSLVATTAASPVNPIGLQKRQDRAIDDVDQSCKYSEDLKTFENAEAALAQTAAGGSLDLYISNINEGSNGWLEKFESWVYLDDDAGGEEARNCALLDNTCKIDAQSCREAFSRADGSDWVKEAWWIYRAVRGAHAKMKMMRSELIKGTIIEGLNIDIMADEFEANLEDDSFTSDGFPDWINTIVALGGAGLSLSSTLSPGYGAGMSVLGTAFGLISENTGDDESATVDRSQVKSSLGQFFNSSIRGVEQTARVAVGRPWDGERYGDLPQLNTWSHHPVVNFYDDPFWLIDDDVKPVNDVITATTGLTKHFLVDMIVKGLGYAISWESSIESSDECGDRAGRKWLTVGGKGRCFTFVQHHKATTYHEVHPDTKLFETMGKYGIDNLETYYRASIDCARSGCKTVQGGVGVGNSESDLPTCVYSLPVLKKDYWESGECDGTSLIGCERSNYLNFFADDVVGNCD